MRRSWKVDAKWLFGLACVAAVIAAGGLYSASKLTEHDPATGIFTGVMASFAKEDDASDGFEELQALAAASPDQEFTIEGATLPVRGHEIVGLSYDAAVDLVVGRIAETLYTEGPEAVEQYFQDAPGADSAGALEGDGGGSDLGPFGLLTSDSHDTIQRIFTFSLIPIVVLAIPLLLFSHRFGRLGSVGVVLAVGTAPFAGLWLIVKEVTKDPSGDGIGAALAQALSPPVGDLSSTFLTLLIIGIAIVLAALVGHTGFALWERFQSRPATAAESTPPKGEPEAQPDQPTGDGPSPPSGEYPPIGPSSLPQP